jgi:hypothetical protein
LINAEHTFEPQIAALASLMIRVYDASDDVFYVNSVHFEEVAEK